MKRGTPVKTLPSCKGNGETTPALSHFTNLLCRSTIAAISSTTWISIHATSLSVSLLRNGERETVLRASLQPPVCLTARVCVSDRSSGGGSSHSLAGLHHAKTLDPDCKTTPLFETFFCEKNTVLYSGQYGTKTKQAEIPGMAL